RLTLLILGDVHKHRPERRLLPYSGAPELVRTRPLLPTLKVLRFLVEQALLQPIDLRVPLRERPCQLRDLRHRCIALPRPTLTLGLCLLRRTGGQHLIVTRTVAI